MRAALYWIGEIVGAFLALVVLPALFCLAAVACGVTAP